MNPFFAKALGMLVCTTVLHAQRIDIKPLDFKPLTSLPWKDTPEVSLEAHLARIYLEPDSRVRYPVLAAYLKQIPSEKLESAFDLCLQLERTQHPENLIAFFLPIWAERDPGAAWKRTEPLFQLQDTHPLDFDRWSNPKMAFRNLVAMRKSSFWMDPRWLENFLTGLNHSHAPTAEKQALREAFMAKWKPIYDSPPSDSYTGTYDVDAPGLFEAFDLPVEKISAEIPQARSKKHVTALSLLLRRWLASKPDKALLIVTLAGKLNAADDALYLLWLQLAPESLIEWVEAQQNLQEPPPRVTGMLLSRVDEKTSQRWLQNARTLHADNRFLNAMICNWASWDPKPALRAALATQEPDIIRDAADSVVYAGFDVRNALHHGLLAIQGHNVGNLPEPLRDMTLSGYGIQIMEYWQKIDIGGSARYGLDFMLTTNYAPRADLIKLFSGDDAFSSDSDMIDRTFCSLRMWAALRPEEMKAWIATQPDADMRKALTWLLEHPWGTDKP